MSTGRKFILFFVICLFLSLGPVAPASSLTGSGCSVSVPGYLADLAIEYEKETGTKVAVRGGGSLQGLYDLLNNRVDFAASCMGKSPYDPSDFDFVRVAWDGLVFIVHKSNPVSTITPENIRDIYEGRITNWKQLGGPDMKIRSFITTPRGMGGVGESLRNMVLKGNPVTKQSNSSMEASSVAIWEQLVEKTPEGFASSGFASARKRNVKMLKVNGIIPNKANIMSDKYPFRRPLYIVMKKDAKPEVRKFVEFVLSKKGQAFISTYGIPSLADVK